MFIAIMEDTSYSVTREDAELAMYFHGGKEKQPTMNVEYMQVPFYKMLRAEYEFVPIEPHVVEEE